MEENKTNRKIQIYNVVNGVSFDLTSEQFGEKAKDLVYDCKIVQERETPGHFGKEEKRRRYEYIKKCLSNRS